MEAIWIVCSHVRRVPGSTLDRATIDLYLHVLKASSTLQRPVCRGTVMGSRKAQTLNDIFEVLEIDPDGKKFDKGKQVDADAM